MEILLLGAGLMAFASVRDMANENIKDVYPAGEKDRTGGVSMQPSTDPGTDRTMNYHNRSQPNFPAAQADSLPLDNSDLLRAFVPEVAERVAGRKEFYGAYAANYELKQRCDHNALDPQRHKYPYPSRYTGVRIRGSPDDVNILGHLVY